MRQMTQPSTFTSSQVEAKGFTVEKDHHWLMSQASSEDTQSTSKPPPQKALNHVFSDLTYFSTKSQSSSEISSGIEEKGVTMGKKMTTMAAAVAAP